MRRGDLRAGFHAHRVTLQRRQQLALLRRFFQADDVPGRRGMLNVMGLDAGRRTDNVEAEHFPVKPA